MLTNEEKIEKLRDFRKKSGLPIKEIAERSKATTTKVLYGVLAGRNILSNTQWNTLNDYMDDYIRRNFDE